MDAPLQNKIYMLLSEAIQAHSMIRATTSSTTYKWKVLKLLGELLETSQAYPELVPLELEVSKIMRMFRPFCEPQASRKMWRVYEMVGTDLRVCLDLFMKEKLTKAVPDGYDHYEQASKELEASFKPKPVVDAALIERYIGRPSVPAQERVDPAIDPDKAEGFSGEDTGA